MTPSRNNKPKQFMFTAIDSRLFLYISQISAFIFLMICLFSDPRSQLLSISNNPAIYNVISLLTLVEALKKRRQEKDKLYRGKKNKRNPYANIPSNKDIYITAAMVLVTLSLFAFKCKMPLLGLFILILTTMIFLVSVSPALGNSMLPLISYGDLIIIERWYFFRRKIKRGDIVSFTRPPGLKITLPKSIIRKTSLQDISLLKRTIAMPGETISVTGGKVYINGTLLTENENIPPAAYEINYLGDLGKDDYKPYSEPEYATTPITVPAKHYFMLGDFRIKGNVDSHVFGFVPENQITGRVIATLPIGSIGVKTKRRDLYQLVQYLICAKKLLQDEKFAEAIDQCNKAVSLYEQSAIAYAYRAWAKQGLQQLDQAIEDCNRSISLYKKTKDPLPGLFENIALPYSIRSTTYTLLKKYKEASQDCNIVMRSSPHEANSYLNRAKVFNQTKKFTEAIRDCDTALAIDPTSAMAYAERAKAKIALKDFDEALADLAEALRLKPKDLEIFANKIIAVLHQGKFQEALDLCDEFDELNSNNATVAFLRASAYLNLGRFQEAYDASTRVLEMNSSYPGAYAARGAASVFLKQWTNALADLNKAINMGSDLGAAFSNRALAYFELGQHEKSMQDCERAIELNPSLAPAYKNRARINLYKNEIRLALNDLYKAIELNPTRGDFYYYRSQAYLALGDTALADINRAKAFELGYVPD